MDIPRPEETACLSYHEELRAWCKAQASLIALSGRPSSVAGGQGHDSIDSPSAETQGLAAPPVRFSPFRRIGIIGAGLMGTTIAAWHLQQGCEVTITDNSPSALRTAHSRVADELRSLGTDRIGDIDLQLSNVQVSERLEELAACDCVLESIAEDVNAKQQLFAALEEELPVQTTLLSNTSTIPIGKLVQGLRHPGRVCGLHFLHPVRSRELVEIIPHSATDESVITRVAQHALAIGKLPVVVGDAPGFVVNRLLFPYLNEALQLICEGISPKIIDRAAEEIGFAMGPVRIMDEIGLDTTWAAGRVLWEAFPERITPSPILVTMLKHKRLGRKSGRGFFDYSVSAATQSLPALDSETERLITPWMAQPPVTQSLSIPLRLVLAMALEAALILMEGIADDPRIIDACAVFGLGFPPSLGGPLFWMQAVGFSKLKSVLEARSFPAMTSQILSAVEKVTGNR